jgi:hypothetical protein
VQRADTSQKGVLTYYFITMHHYAVFGVLLADQEKKKKGTNGMALTKYRITAPTLLLVSKDVGHSAAMVPPEAVVTSTDSQALHGNRLVRVTWDNKTGLMFAQDLRCQTELIRETQQLPSR